VTADLRVAAADVPRRAAGLDGEQRRPGELAAEQLRVDHRRVVVAVLGECGRGPTASATVASRAMKRYMDVSSSERGFASETRREARALDRERARSARSDAAWT